MISLITELTDAKGMRAARGFVFFDRDCAVCTAFARRFRCTLAQCGFALAALQDPRAQALLHLPAEELLREMRVVTVEGSVLSGAAAIVCLARHIWWAWPLYATSKLPGASRLLDAGYRWFGDHRSSSDEACNAFGKYDPKT